ncbi:YAP-binding/ALF4/Glomulin [Dipodascopsis uninucleata]
MSTDKSDAVGTDIKGVVNSLRAAARDTVETDDYITYSTLLDIHLSNCSTLEESTRVELLQGLESILLENEGLLSHVAWDLPILLLPYLESSENFEDVAAAKGLTSRRLAFSIFNLVAEKGNAKEVFLKSIEALSSLSLDIDDAAAIHEKIELEKVFVLKFYALFEVIVSVTRRIITQYPSRFLTTSSSALLSFLSTHIDELYTQSLSVIVRRLYLFARDYVPPVSKTPVDPEEEALQRRMLQSYITHLVEIIFRTANLDWSNRYFNFIKKDIKVLPERERQRETSVVGNGALEMVERFLQLTSSFDMHPSMFVEAILEEPAEMDQEESDDLTFPSPPTSASSIPLSSEGCFLLLSEFLMSEKNHKIRFTLPQIILISKRFTNQDDHILPSAGVCDSIGLYGWMFLKDITPEEIAEVSQEDFNSYLHIITALSATQGDAARRFLLHTLVVHLLSLSSRERAYEYIFDTLMYCPYENACEAFVVVLKDFLKSPGRSNSTNTKSSRKSIMGTIEYDQEKQEQINDLIQDCIGTVDSRGSLLLDEKFSVLQAWISNFLVVMGGDTQFLKDVISKVKRIIDKDARLVETSENMNSEEKNEHILRQRLLQAGVQSLENGQLESKLNSLSI